MSSEEKTELPVKQQPKFTDRFLRLYNSQRQSDLEIVAGKGSVQKVYKAHRLILAAGSDVFEAMFYGAFQNKDKTLNLPDVDPDAFGIVLKYFYTGSVALRNTEEACHLLYAAKKYLLNELAEQCRTYIKKEMSPDTVCNVYRVASSFEGEDELVKACVKMLKVDTMAVMDSDSFLSAPPSLIEELVSLEPLNIDSEADLIKSVLAWSKAECKRQKKASGHTPKRRKVLSFALPKLRFLTLTPEEFQSMKEELDFFTPEEYCAILSCIVTPLPDDISCNYIYRLQLDDEEIEEDEKKIVGNKISKKM